MLTLYNNLSIRISLLYSPFIRSLFPDLRYWFVLATFFFMHFFVRVTPPLIALDLIRDFQLSSTQIGMLTSVYFIVYTLSQLLTGVLLKNYSTRLLLSGACLGCGLSTFGISQAGGFYTILLSLISYAFFGSFGFIGATSYAAKTLPKHSSLLAGLTKSLGMSAGFLALNGVTWALIRYSWREITGAFAIGLTVWSSIIFLFGPKDTAIKNSSDSALDIKSRMEIYKDLRTWKNALYAGLLYFPMMVLTEGGFGPRLLGSLHPQTGAEIAFAISMIFIAWMVGAPLAGTLSDRIGSLPIMKLSAISGVLTMALILFIPMPCWALSISLFLFGITNTGLIGSYTLAMRLHGAKNSSISLAITNLSSILVGSIIGAILPVLLETSSHAAFLEGVPYYHGGDYKRIFGAAMVATPLLAYILALQLEKEEKKTL